MFSIDESATADQRSGPTIDGVRPPGHGSSESRSDAQRGAPTGRACVQEEPFLHAATSDKTRLTCGNTQRRQHGTGPAPITPLPPSGPAAGSSQWFSTLVSDTALSRSRPPQYEVLTKTIERVQKPVAGPGFGDYESMRAMCEDSGSIVIGFDTEFTRRPAFEGLPGVQSRTIDSYQFAAMPSDGPDRDPPGHDLAGVRPVRGGPAQRADLA